ncbi:MAG: hemolysin family protein [Victivallales bacterium]|jgi:putative hemolysin
MEIIVIFILIFINGLFALTEIAFVSSRREILEGLQASGSRNAAKVLKMMNEPDTILSSIQVGITLIGIISGAFGGVILADDLCIILKKMHIFEAYAYQISMVFIVTSVTYISIIFGELVPKSVGLRNPEKTILLLYPVINIFSHLAYPAVALLSYSTRLILKIAGLGLTGIDQISDPVKTILGIAKSAVIKNKIHRAQEKIITNTINVKDVTVAELMVKKDEIKYLSADMSLNQALVEAHIHHHTRYPIVEGNDINRIIGYVNFKDIMNAIRLSPEKPTVRNISRNVLFVSESEKVLDVLQKLIKSYQHIAIVRSVSSGTTTGLISLENLLETIVGDIRDEFDVLPEFIYNLTEERWLAGGGVQLDKISKTVGVSLPESDKSLCQWLMEISDANIRVENRIEYGELIFHIRKMSRSKVYEVIIEKTNPA